MSIQYQPALLKTFYDVAAEENTSEFLKKSPLNDQHSFKLLDEVDHDGTVLKLLQFTVQECTQQAVISNNSIYQGRTSTKAYEDASKKLLNLSTKKTPGLNSDYNEGIANVVNQWTKTFGEIDMQVSIGEPLIFSGDVNHISSISNQSAEAIKLNSLFLENKEKLEYFYLGSGSFKLDDFASFEKELSEEISNDQEEEVTLENLKKDLDSKLLRAKRCKESLLDFLSKSEPSFEKNKFEHNVARLAKLSSRAFIDTCEDKQKNDRKDGKEIIKTPSEAEEWIDNYSHRSFNRVAMQSWAIKKSEEICFYLEECILEFEEYQQSISKCEERLKKDPTAKEMLEIISKRKFGTTKKLRLYLSFGSDAIKIFFVISSNSLYSQNLNPVNADSESKKIINIVEVGLVRNCLFHLNEVYKSVNIPPEIKVYALEEKVRISKSLIKKQGENKAIYSLYNLNLPKKNEEVKNIKNDLNLAEKNNFKKIDIKSLQVEGINFIEDQEKIKESVEKEEKYLEIQREMLPITHRSYKICQKISIFSDPSKEENEKYHTTLLGLIKKSEDFGEFDKKCIYELLNNFDSLFIVLENKELRKFVSFFRNTYKIIDVGSSFTSKLISDTDIYKQYCSLFGNRIPYFGVLSTMITYYFAPLVGCAVAAVTLYNLYKGKKIKSREQIMIDLLGEQIQNLHNSLIEIGSALSDQMDQGFKLLNNEIESCKKLIKSSNFELKEAIRLIREDSKKRESERRYNLSKKELSKYASDIKSANLKFSKIHPSEKKINQFSAELISFIEESTSADKNGFDINELENTFNCPGYIEMISSNPDYYTGLFLSVIEEKVVKIPNLHNMLSLFLAYQSLINAYKIFYDKPSNICEDMKETTEENISNIKRSITENIHNLIERLSLESIQKGFEKTISRMQKVSSEIKNVFELPIQKSYQLKMDFIKKSAEKIKENPQILGKSRFFIHNFYHEKPKELEFETKDKNAILTIAKQSLPSNRVRFLQSDEEGSYKIPVLSPLLSVVRDIINSKDGSVSDHYLQRIEENLERIEETEDPSFPKTENINPFDKNYENSYLNLYFFKDVKCLKLKSICFEEHYLRQRFKYFYDVADFKNKKECLSYVVDLNSKSHCFTISNDFDNQVDGSLDDIKDCGFVSDESYSNYLNYFTEEGKEFPLGGAIVEDEVTFVPGPDELSIPLAFPKIVIEPLLNEIISQVSQEMTIYPQYVLDKSENGLIYDLVIQFNYFKSGGEQGIVAALEIASFDHETVQMFGDITQDDHACEFKQINPNENEFLYHAMYGKHAGVGLPGCKSVRLSKGSVIAPQDEEFPGVYLLLQDPKKINFRWKDYSGPSALNQESPCGDSMLNNLLNSIQSNESNDLRKLKIKNRELLAPQFSDTLKKNYKEYCEFYSALKAMLATCFRKNDPHGLHPISEELYIENFMAKSGVNMSTGGLEEVCSSMQSDGCGSPNTSISGMIFAHFSYSPNYEQLLRARVELENL